MSKFGDEGCHHGIAKSSAAPVMSKAAAKEPRVVFTVKVYARPAMSRSIESVQIREALEECCRQFGGGVGGKLSGTIYGPYDIDAETRPAWGKFEYSPSCPP